jgi:hypothetical protein
MRKPKFVDCGRCESSWCAVHKECAKGPSAMTETTPDQLAALREAATQGVWDRIMAEFVPAEDAVNAARVSVARADEAEARATAAEAENAKLREALRIAADCLDQCASGEATQNDMETWAEDARQALEEATDVG